jgi:hypothetical protein
MFLLGVISQIHVQIEKDDAKTSITMVRKLYFLVKDVPFGGLVE